MKKNEKTREIEESKENISMNNGESFYREIGQYQTQGIHMADIAKLKQAGLNTVMSVSMSCRKDILNIKGITYAKENKIYEAASKIECGGFCSAFEEVTKREN